MTDQEIRAHIFLSLARLYEDPMHRKQYYRFTFEPPDKKPARKILANLNRNLVVEQVQPGVVRLTDLGYQLIRKDLERLRMEADGPSDEQPPSPEEIESISDKLGKPDYVSASRFKDGIYEVYWATDGIKKVTGYSVEELNKAGGLLAVVQSNGTLRQLKQIALTLLDDNEVADEIDIVTKNGRIRRIQFVARPRYDSKGRITGSINAIKDITAPI